MQDTPFKNIKKRSTEDVIGQMIFDVENSKSRHDFVEIACRDMYSKFIYF